MYEAPSITTVGDFSEITEYYNKIGKHADSMANAELGIVGTVTKIS